MGFQITKFAGVGMLIIVVIVAALLSYQEYLDYKMKKELAREKLEKELREVKDE